MIVILFHPLGLIVKNENKAQKKKIFKCFEKKSFKFDSRMIIYIIEQELEELRCRIGGGDSSGSETISEN